jgi:cytochrome P450
MTTTALGPPVYDPYDYAIHEDPYPTYARLRSEAPVYRNEALDFWALSRHRHVLAAFRDVESFSNAYGVSLDPAAFGPHAHRSMSFLAMDPPAHTRLRSLVGKSFTPRRVAELEPRIRQLAVEHLEPAVERGSFDFISDFAGLLPMDVISELMGVPPSDRAELRRLADTVVHREEGMADVPPEGAEAAMSLVAYYADMVAQRRRRPLEDLTSALMESDGGGDRLTDEEIIGILFLLVVAGNETTTKLLGNAWYWGWRFPDEGSKPLNDPARVSDWVEETLRYDNSTQMLVRVTRTDVPIDGTVVPAGEKVLLLIGSANRDDEVFDDPDRYDLERPATGADAAKLVSFGGGRHFCMGAALARLEARVALGELVRRVGSYDVDPEGIARVHSINVRGLAALPTTVRAR